MFRSTPPRWTIDWTSAASSYRDWATRAIAFSGRESRRPDCDKFDTLARSANRKGEMKRGTIDASLPMWVLGCAPSGPYTFDQVRAMWAAGQLKSDQQYCQQGMKTWCP